MLKTTLGTVNTMTLAAGEPFLKSIQWFNSSDVVQLASDKALGFSIYTKNPDGSTKRRHYAEGEAFQDSTGQFMLWRIDGSVSQTLYDTVKEPLFWEYSDRLDNGKDVILSGTLKIVESAPDIADNDNAPIARVISRLRVIDVEAEIGFPIFKASTAYYSSLNAVPVGTPVAPANTVLPTISGTARVGETLTATTGAWTGSPTNYTRQWKAGNIAISGATGASYVVQPSDAGKSLTVTVTATNAVGSASATSGSTSTVVVAPVTAPVNSIVPTIAGTARANELLTATTGTWSGSPTFTYQWKANATNLTGATASTLALTANEIGKTISVTVTATNAGGSAAATSAATTAVTAAASFTAAPSVDGSANRVEGDVFTYTSGTVVNGTVGEVALFKDNVRKATLTSGSGAFDFGAGSYFIRSFIAGSATYADSTAITVTAVVAKPITPPLFYFDQARVAGTNPPEVYWDDVDDTVYATDTLEVEWTTGGSTFSKHLTMNISSRSLHDFTISEWSNLAAGSFSVRGRYRRTKDINGNTITEVISAWSAALSDTLSAKGLTPAATIFDIQNKSNQMKVSTTDYLNARGNNVGAAQPVAVTIARSDKRFAEFKIVADHGTNRGGFNLGIIPSTTVIDPGSYSGPTGFVSVNVAASSFVAGDVYTLLVTPQVGSTAGQIILQKNGVQAGTASHNITDYKLVFNCAREVEVRLNTGKEAFSFAPTDTTYVRYN